MLVEAWRYLEGRIRVTIMNCETVDTPSMMARTRHTPIVEAIERGDVAAAKSVVEQHMAAAAQQYAPHEELIFAGHSAGRAAYLHPSEPRRGVDSAIPHPSLFSSSVDC